MGIQDFLMRKMLAAKLKDVPAAEQEKLLGMLEKNPELFQKMAEEIQVAMKSGKSEMNAAMEIAKKYQTELQRIAQ